MVGVMLGRQVWGRGFYLGSMLLAWPLGSGRLQPEVSAGIRWQGEERNLSLYWVGQEGVGWGNGLLGFQDAGLALHVTYFLRTQELFLAFTSSAPYFLYKFSLSR